MFWEISLAFLPIIPPGRDAASQTELHLPRRKHRLVLMTFQGVFTLAAPDLRVQLLYLDL